MKCVQVLCILLTAWKNIMWWASDEDVFVTVATSFPEFSVPKHSKEQIPNSSKSSWTQITKKNWEAVSSVNKTEHDNDTYLMENCTRIFMIENVWVGLRCSLDKLKCRHKNQKNLFRMALLKVCNGIKAFKLFQRVPWVILWFVWLYLMFHLVNSIRFWKLCSLWVWSRKKTFHTSWDWDNKRFGKLRNA